MSRHWGTGIGCLIALLGTGFGAAVLAAPIERRFPPISSCDTIIMHRDWLKPKSIHGNDVAFIQDAEILQIHQPVLKIRVGERAKVSVRILADGRAVIQQQAVRGCTAGVAAMLIHDNGGKVNVETLRGRNLGNTDSIRRDIEAAGLEPIVTRMPGDAKLARLAQLIARDGPAIVGVGGEIGGHVVIVDALDFRAGVASLRDPYHGWAIDVPLYSLGRRMGHGKAHDVIQVRRRNNVAAASSRDR